MRYSIALVVAILFLTATAASAGQERHGQVPRDQGVEHGFSGHPGGSNEQGHWGHGGGGHVWGNGWHGPRGYDDPLGGLVGGIVGGAIAGTIGSWFAPPAVVVVPEPVPSGPPVWSPEWLDQCQGKYKSFDAHTGYYTGYDGVQHFCQ